MKIENISIRNDGYVYCKSCFYFACDSISCNSSYNFSTGINRLSGEIDSENWAVSYLLSMYKYKYKYVSYSNQKIEIPGFLFSIYAKCGYVGFILFEKPEVIVNNSNMPLKEFAEYSCYMDELYPLFSTKVPIRKLIARGLKKTKMDASPEEIRDMFCLDSERFERPVKQVGNERFRSMAAIAYAHGKQVYCFPWLSKKRFDYYHRNITWLLEKLESLGMIVILPVGE